MTAATFKTPQDLTITPRDRRFGQGEAQKRWWLAGDPIATAFYNALSITFPRGEAMFIDSVKAFRDGVPEKLAQEIKAFISQEVMHSREHVAFNKAMVDAGYDTSKLERQITEILEMIKSRPLILNLAVTMALEHYTAILAVQFLKDKKLSQGADKAQADLWRWHAIEEIEHKGVAYDTWLHATKDWTRFKRWRVKAIMMTLVSIRFWKNRYQGMLWLLEQDGITGWEAHRGLLWYMFGNPGMLRRIILPILSFYLPGFHPWNHDDRALIAGVDADLAANSAYADARLPEAVAA
jgi:uncharacterized protein